MSEYYHIVPWFNTEEWQRVYDEIFITANKDVALKYLQIWKARCPLLPSGVESTFGLLQVQVQDVNNAADIVNDQFLRLAYSAAVMRFVNHMLDAETSKGTSLYHAAKNLRVPDWIVDLRHDTAHSNNLPSIELLREASVIGLNWLRTYYWDKYKECIEDYITGQKGKSNVDETRIATLVHFCISLSICTHHKSNIKKLSQIPEAEMKESIICDVRELFGDLIDLSNMKTVSIMSLVNIMNGHCKKILRGKDTAGYVNKILLGDDSIFLSLDLVQYLCENDFDHKNRLNTSYVKCFELLLTLLHTNELLLEFILELINITTSNSNKDKCRLAAFWVSEILQALRKSKDFVEKIENNNTDIHTKKRKELKSLYHHWFPNDDRNCLLLDLIKAPPPPLLELDYVKPIISEYNQYLTYFIKDLLNLVEPPIPKIIKAKILKLANFISAPEKNISLTTSKIYTLDDLKRENKENVNSTQPYLEPNDWNQSIDTEMINEETQEPAQGTIWKLCSKEINWATCPIGQML